MALPEMALSRRERRRLEIRERILEAARRVFEASGYEASTVGEIAERADIAYGTFFNHFPTKLDLLRELTDRTLLEVFEDVEEVRKHPGTFAERFVEIFDRTAERTEQMGPRAREMVAAMMNLAHPETTDREDHHIRLMFRHLLEDGRASGELRSDEDIETLLEVAVGTWSTLFLSWVHLDGYPLRQRAARAGRFLARTLVAPAT